jgi:hypothetical protein
MGVVIRNRRQFLALALVSGLVLLIPGITNAAPALQGTPRCSAEVALPPIVHFVQPGAGVPVASLAGSWEGAWDGALPSRLIIEMVDGDKALVLYTWGDHAPTNARRGWGRIWGTIQGNSLDFHSLETVKFSFTLSDDQVTLTGERTFPNGTNRITMTRCQQ